MDPQKRYKPQKTWLTFVIIVAAGAIFLLIGSYFLLNRPEPQFEKSDAQKLKPGPKTATGGVGTQRYNNLLRKNNEKKAEQALKDGSSSFPDMIGQEASPIVVIKKHKAPAKKAVVQQAPEKSQKKEAERDLEYEKFYKTYSKAVADIANTEDKKLGKSKIIKFKNKNKKESFKKNPEKESPSLTPEKSPLNLKPGDQLYVSNIIAVNSDVPSVVHAEIVSGEYTRGKLFGKFERHGKYLLVKFNQLGFNQATYQINAIAFDIETMSAAVRSSVDAHYIERWGGLIAASFLEGFGEAVEKSGSSLATNDFTTTQSYPDYDTGEQMWIAAGNVGNTLADIMKKNFTRPPTVYLDSGMRSMKGMVGVLILGVK